MGKKNIILYKLHVLSFLTQLTCMTPALGRGLPYRQDRGTHCSFKWLKTWFDRVQSNLKIFKVGAFVDRAYLSHKI